MVTGIYTKHFAEVFASLLSRSGVSCYQISQYADINQAYPSRLKNGEKNNPSPEIVMRIGLALVHCSNRIRMSDIEKLFNATGRTLSPNHRGY